MPLAVALCQCTSRSPHRIQGKPRKMHFVSRHEWSGVDNLPSTLFRMLSPGKGSFLLHSIFPSAELHGFLLLPLPHSSVVLQFLLVQVFLLQVCLPLSPLYFSSCLNLGFYSPEPLRKLPQLPQYSERVSQE